MSLSWTETNIGEIAIVDWGNTSLTKKAFVEDGPYLGVSAAGCDGRMEHAEHKKFTPVLSAIGAQCGRMFLPDEDFTAIKNTITLTPKSDQTDPIFLYYLMTFVELPQRGAGQPFISKGDIQKFSVSIPPLEEQKRIVAVLDQAFAVLDRAHANVEANLADAEELFDRQLSCAFAEAGKSAERRSFEHLCKALTPKTKIMRKNYLAEGAYPIVSQEADLISGYWDEPSALMGLKEPVVVFGDHTRCLKYVDFDFVVGADGTKVLKPFPDVNALYLYYGLRSIPIAEKGYARHFRFLKEASLPHLDEAKQERLATSLRAAEEQVSQLAKAYETKLGDLEDLRQSILQKAFAGELT